MAADSVCSRDRPMDDADIDERIFGQAELAMSAEQARSALTAYRQIEAIRGVAVSALVVVRRR